MLTRHDSSLSNHSNPHKFHIDCLHKLVNSTGCKILPELGPILATIRTMSGDGIGQLCYDENNKVFIKSLPEIVEITAEFIFNMYDGSIVPLTMDPAILRCLRTIRQTYYHSYILQGDKKVEFIDITWESNKVPIELTFVFSQTKPFGMSCTGMTPIDFDAIYANFAYSNGFVSTLVIYDDDIERVYINKKEFPSNWKFVRQDKYNPDYARIAPISPEFYEFTK